MPRCSVPWPGLEVSFMSTPVTVGSMEHRDFSTICCDKINVLQLHGNKTSLIIHRITVDVHTDIGFNRAQLEIEIPSN